MVLSLYIQSIKVFLADVTDGMQTLRSDVRNILLRAGIEVIETATSTETDIEKLMLTADCSMHILGSDNIIDNDSVIYDTPSALQYRTARSINNATYKMFLWNPSGGISDNNLYINDIRRDINDNTIYSDITSPIVFVEELRTIMNVKPAVKTDAQSFDMLFIYNSLDRDSAKEVSNMLADLHSVTDLEISAGTDTDYTDYISNQLPLCRLGIIYYDYASDWAPSFAQQVWKQTGGQSSATQLFIAGNSEHVDETQLKPLKKILPYTINEKSIIPLEIKIYYDKITGKTT
ncbi:MAG: hypothetical protein J6Z01_01940 [Bacteroidales bacterium]|nr:hypothetical protein [Bacteroidales bacterium]